MKRLPHNSADTVHTHPPSPQRLANPKERQSFSLVYREQGHWHVWEDGEDLCLGEDLKKPLIMITQLSWASTILVWIAAIASYPVSLLLPMPAPQASFQISTQQPEGSLKISHIMSFFCSTSSSNVQFHSFPWPTRSSMIFLPSSF